MAQVIFYQKPGCINNAKQKALLLAASHQVEARNLLTTPWTAATLRPFFGNRPVSEWFNPSAPRIKSGEVNPAILDEATALQLMIAEPLLIRRPLLRMGNEYRVGFDYAQIHRWIGLRPLPPKMTNLEACPRQSHLSCPSPLLTP